MARSRLGVALLLPEPAHTEVRALRHALGSPSLLTQPPHITLAPPVNVRNEDVDLTLELVRTISARSKSFRVRLGPIETFSPISPVLYLGVHGEDVAALRELRNLVFAGPLYRRVSYDYVPHCTLHESATDELLTASLASIADYRCVVDLNSVDVLRQDDDRTWRSLGSFDLQRPTTRGRGSIEVSIGHTTIASAATRYLVSQNDQLHQRRPWCLEARRTNDSVVATAIGHIEGGMCFVQSIVVDSNWRSVGIGDHVLTEVLLFAESRQATTVVMPTTSESWIRDWYVRRSFRSEGFQQMVYRSS